MVIGGLLIDKWEVVFLLRIDMLDWLLFMCFVDFVIVNEWYSFMLIIIVDVKFYELYMYFYGCFNCCIIYFKIDIDYINLCYLVLIIFL